MDGFWGITCSKMPNFPVSDKIRLRHEHSTSNHLGIRLISIAYCKVGECWDIIRQITTWDGFVIFSAYVYKHILRDLWNALIIGEEL